MSPVTSGWCSQPYESTSCQILNETTEILDMHYAPRADFSYRPIVENLDEGAAQPQFSGFLSVANIL
jgi:hypothetical protein